MPIAELFTYLQGLYHTEYLFSPVASLTREALIYKKSDTKSQGLCDREGAGGRAHTCGNARSKLRTGLFRNTPTTTQEAEEKLRLKLAVHDRLCCKEWPMKQKIEQASKPVILTAKKARISGLRLDISSMSVSTSRMSGGKTQTTGGWLHFSNPKKLDDASKKIKPGFPIQQTQNCPNRGCFHC